MEKKKPDSNEQDKLKAGRETGGVITGLLSRPRMKSSLKPYLLQESSLTAWL